MDCEGEWTGEVVFNGQLTVDNGQLRTYENLLHWDEGLTRIRSIGRATYLESNNKIK